MDAIIKIFHEPKFWLTTGIMFIWICAYIGSVKTWKNVLFRLMSLVGGYIVLFSGINYVHLFGGILEWLNPLTSLCIAWLFIVGTCSLINWISDEKWNPILFITK